MEDSTNAVKIFENERFGQVRTIEEGDKILFCGSDVAKALGYSNAPDALNRHCRAIVKRDTPISGKIQAISFIPEGDVYRLIARSKLPEAEKFESWVFDEILPTVRKTGGDPLAIGNPPEVAKQIFPSSSISNHTNNLQTICGVECYEKNGTAYLKLETVARGLGFTRVAASGNEVVRWERVDGYLAELNFVPTCGHESFIPENIFYRLAMKAKNEVAEKFQALVADEIIPTIRKTGGYVANDDQFIATYLPFADESTKMLFRATLEVVNQQNKKIAADAPKVNYYDALIDRGVSLSLRETGKELGLGQNRFIARLVEDKYLYRTSNNKLCAYSEYTESGKGYFALKECVNHASDWGGVQTLVTPKGRDFFRRKYGTLQ